MPTRERNFRGMPIHGQDISLNPLRAGATVIAFQPLGTTAARRSSSRGAGRSRGADPSGAATAIPVLLPRSFPGFESAAKSAKRAERRLITGEEEYRQRMFENLLAAAWVGTLMSAGYYMLSVLAAPSMSMFH